MDFRTEDLVPRADLYTEYDSITVPSQAVKNEGAKELGDHYRQGYTEQIEVARIISDKLSKEELVGAYKFNIIKYVLRAPWKGGLNDYKKAQDYLNRLIKLLSE